LACVCLGWGQSPGALAVVSAADYVSQISPGSIATAFGTNLPADSNTSVNVCTGSPAVCTQTTVFAAFATQISFLVPDPLPGSSAVVQVLHSGTVVAAGSVPVSALSPAVFSADSSGTGIFSGQSYDRGQYNAVFAAGPAPSGIVPVAVAGAIGGVPNTLILYGTGWKHAGLPSVRVTMGGLAVTPDYAGPSSSPGLDQLNVRIPSSLAAQGALLVDISISFTSAADSTTGVYNTRLTSFCLAGLGGDRNCPTLHAAQPSCMEPLPGVSAPYAPHGIFALQFPGANPAPINNYIRQQPAVCGGNLYVVWNQVDQGIGSYDWSSVDNLIAPWVNAGKSVNLVVWGVSDARPNNGTPAYVMNDPAYRSVTCQENGQTLQYPVYYTGSYRTYYSGFIQAVMNRYGANPNVGYIRFGLARGGEVFPTCLTQMMAFSGLTSIGQFNTVWEDYLTAMTGLQKDLHTGIVSTAGHAVQLMTALDPYGSPVQYAVNDFEAANARSLGFGFGSQGLSLSDVNSYQAGRNCGANWCNAFLANYGLVPLELQTIAASDPANAPGGTGSLPVLLPFALKLHTQVFEVYIQDLQVAYDPTSPNYTQYGQAYRQVFEQVAAALGSAPAGYK
jgi:uncharacterized protein (TIGR03437 family)